MSDSPSNYVMFDPDDPEMQEAGRSARATFRYCWREIAWDRRRIVPFLDIACVKAPFSDGKRSRLKPGQSEFEFMWVNDIEFDGRFVSGVLANRPNWLKSVNEGDSVSFPLDEITDWMYAINGEVYGGYTLNLLRSRLNKRERRDYERAWGGLKFGDPTIIRVVPLSNHEDALAQDWYGEERGDTEHSMSEGMALSLKDQLLKDRSLMTSSDHNGMTLLHHQALMGCAASVKVLLKAGADRNVLTRQGMTPLQLAQTLGWESVVALLTAGDSSSGAVSKRAIRTKNESPESPAKSVRAVCSVCKAEVRVSGDRSNKSVVCRPCSQRNVAPQKRKSADTRVARNEKHAMTPIVIGGGLLTFAIIAALIFIGLWKPAAKAPEREGIVRQPDTVPQTIHRAEPAAPIVDNVVLPAKPDDPRPPSNGMPTTLPHLSKQNRANPLRGINGPNARPIPQPILPTPPFSLNFQSNAEKSDIVGGSGGIPFQTEITGKTMAGVEWKAGEWAGVKAVSAIQPITASGLPTPGYEQVIAPQGYAVGGINVGASQFVNNVQLIFMKLRTDGSLDPTDTKLSKWLGGEPTANATTISGEGRRVIGLCGRGAAVIDAIGLVFEPKGRN